MNLVEELEALVERARKDGDSHRRSLAALRQDRDLTDDAKAIRRAELQAAARARVEGMRTDMDRMRARLLERAAKADSGIPAPSSDAVARVRGLLGQGKNPQEILDLAVHLKDVDTLEALRTEVRWSNLGADVDGFVRAVDRASLPLLEPAQRSSREERLSLDEAWAKAKPVIDAESEPGVGPTLETSIAVRMGATNGHRLDPKAGQPSPGSPMEAAVERRMAEPADAGQRA